MKERIKYIIGRAIGWILVFGAVLVITLPIIHSYRDTAYTLKVRNLDLEVENLKLQVRTLNLFKLNEMLEKNNDEMSDDIEKALILDSTIFERSKNIKLPEDEYK